MSVATHSAILFVMDPIGTLMLALGALVVLDLVAPHLAGDRRARRPGVRRSPVRR